MEANDEFEAEWIWIDDEGTAVYAQGYGRGLTLIFSFHADQNKPSFSLANRVCTKYEEIEVADAASTFDTLEDMRAAIWGVIRRIYPHCISHPDLTTRLDAVIGVDSLDGTVEKATWDVYAHPLFPRYIQHLANDSHRHIPVNPENSVDFASLIRYEQLGGRGCTTRVRLPSGEYSVFKGVDFRIALNHSDNEDDKWLRNLISSWHREYDTLHQLPPHPNILPPPSVLVTIQWPDRSVLPVPYGALFPLYSGGNAASRIEDSNGKGLRIPLELKARWCANMAAAIFHTHRVAKTYHMDIKPGNFVADSRDNLILCDWEQDDAPATTIAPEADGTWDVTEDLSTVQSGRPRLLYERYSGAPRRNIDGDVLGDAPWRAWSVFPIWSAEHPWALELAEVFSLGRSMWMLLRQPEMDFEDIEHPDQLVTSWENSEDIPVNWTHFVDQCMSREPNERPDLSQLVDFWTSEWTMQKTAIGHK